MIADHDARQRLSTILDFDPSVQPDSVVLSVADLLAVRQPVVEGEFNGAPFAVKIKEFPEGFRMRLRGVTANAIVCSPQAAALHGRLPEKQAADTSKLIISPMPGLVVTVEVKVGQDVKAGESVAIVEAMKMQNIIRAERDGVVKTVNVAAGASVAADEVLVELA